MTSLNIKNLHVKVGEREILKGVNLHIGEGETVALLGPNGHGKSTLLNVIMGHPNYTISEGTIEIDGKDISSLGPDERSLAGVFLGMQYPSEIPGVINSDFLKAAINARNEKPISLLKFYKLLDNASKELGMPLDLANRSLNEGFSGGEKKRNEILQMMILNPKFVLLDEIDSGLDVDAIQLVAEAIRKEQTSKKSFLIISHYARLFELVPATRTIVMVNGKIVLEGGPELINKIDSEGYEFLKTNYGINIEKDIETMSQISIGSCAIKEAN
jgi:Fe-S cluster assembly ATP-binding protein